MQKILEEETKSTAKLRQIALLRLHVYRYSVHWCKKAKGTSTYDKAKGREDDIPQAWSLKF
jgi:uncharacterized protein YecA (UPF0149 family)